jgi:hypothetical protein
MLGPQRFEDPEFFSHFPEDVSEEIQNHIREGVLKDSRYLFTHREGRKQYAYCTHCKREHESKGLKHGESSQCPLCKSLVWVKASGRGRKTLIDEAYLLWYEKSVTNKQAIIARGFYLIRDYTKDYRETETVIKPIALYVFEPGVGGKMKRCNYWGCYKDTWHGCKTVHSEATSSMKYKNCYFYKHNIKKAVKGTPFEYCTWELYDHKDMVEFFDIAAKYKCIEFLSKVGLGCFVNTKLEGGSTYGAINWRGDTPEKVLRLTKSEIKEMRKTGAIGMRALRHYQILKREGPRLTWIEAREMSDLIDDYNAGELRKFTRYASIQTIKLYFAKQMRREGKYSYRSGGEVLSTWRDYIRDCIELGMDLSQDHVLFPNNLHAAHQKTIKKVKIKADETLNHKTKSRLKELDRFKFENNGLILRPAVSSIELFEEGKTLHHCVGGYAKRYADGDIDLFVLRKASDPNTPFYTVEVIGQNITQVRGKKNCNPTEEVKTFMEAFKKERVSKKRRKDKAKIARPA